MNDTLNTSPNLSIPDRASVEPLSVLPPQARELAQASISPNTRRAYTRALGRLDDALEADGRPLDDAALAAYLSNLFEGGRSPAVASQTVAAVKFRCRLQGQASPVGPLTERVLAGYRRQGRQRGSGQVAPVRWEQADAAASVAANGKGTIRGLRDAALLLVASDALLRVSEVAALDVEDIGYSPDGSGTIAVRSSKTDQEGRGEALFLGKPTMNRLRAWIGKAEISQGALFRRLSRGGRVMERLSTRSVRTIIQQRAKAAGVEGRVSGHSMRVGSAQSLAVAGATVVDMQQAGRWRSPDQPGQYSRRQLAGQGAVARFRYGR